MSTTSCSSASSASASADTSSAGSSGSSSSGSSSSSSDPAVGTPKYEIAFKLFDQDDNGYIDAREFQQAAAVAGVTMTRAQAESQLKGIDKDDDERVSLAEFEHWWKNEGESLSMGDENRSLITSLKTVEYTRVGRYSVKTMLAKINGKDTIPSSKNPIEFDFSVAAGNLKSVPSGDRMAVRFSYYDDDTPNKGKGKGKGKDKGKDKGKAKTKGKGKAKGKDKDKKSKGKKNSKRLANPQAVLTVKLRLQDGVSDDTVAAFEQILDEIRPDLAMMGLAEDGGLVFKRKGQVATVTIKTEKSQDLKDLVELLDIVNPQSRIEGGVEINHLVDGSIATSAGKGKAKGKSKKKGKSKSSKKEGDLLGRAYVNGKLHEGIYGFLADFYEDMDPAIRDQYFGYGGMPESDLQQMRYIAEVFVTLSTSLHLRFKSANDMFRKLSLFMWSSMEGGFNELGLDPQKALSDNIFKTVQQFVLPLVQSGLESLDDAQRIMVTDLFDSPISISLDLADKHVDVDFQHFDGLVQWGTSAL